MLQRSLAILVLISLAGCNASSRDMAELNQILMQGSSSFSNQAQQNLANSSNYRIPQATSYYGGSNSTIHCVTAGIYTNCR